MGPRAAIREALVELADLKRALLSNRPAVLTIERLERLLYHALGQRATGEIPIQRHDPDDTPPDGTPAPDDPVT